MTLRRASFSAAHSMADSSIDQTDRRPGLAVNHIPIHLRRDSRSRDALGDKPATAPQSSIESQGLATAFGQRRHFPESLHFASSSFRLRSRTASTRSSISSANVPDSATTYSHSTLASPISTSYASDLSDVFCGHPVDASRPASRVLHRHRSSTGSFCSAHANDDDDGFSFAGYPDLSAKLGEIRVATPATPVPAGESDCPDQSARQAQKTEEEESLTPSDSRDWPQLETATIEPSLSSKWDTASSTSEDVSSHDTEAILDYTLQLVFGVDLQEEASKVTPAVRSLVCKFVGDVGSCFWATPSDADMTQVMSSSSSSSTPSQGGSGAGDSQSGGKRKKQGRGDEDDGEFSDGDGLGYTPLKKLRPNPKDEENLRLSCPYRKRNPSRFNVRDHHSCAMTYFPKFAELRQHIVKQHKRDDPSAFVCDRCNRDFHTRKELRDHQRLPKEMMCDILDHDPESGVDGTTSIKLLSRKRVSGASPEAQWKEIWNILFPDDEDHQIHSYHFTPVIEHFELSNYYMASFEVLHSSLRDKISNPATLETLTTKFQQCFMEAVERCIGAAQSMPYTNRSNKRNEPSRAQSFQTLIPRKGREILPRPDSGVVMMDECSEESGSIRNSTFVTRDSTRTVVKDDVRRRGSNLAPDPSTTAPTPAAMNMLDGSFSGHMSFMPHVSVPVPTDSVAVQSWSNGVSDPNDGDIGNSFPMTDQFYGPGELTPHGDLGSWHEEYYQSFQPLDDRFHGFGEGLN
ncbi:zinc finger domain-containing [Trichoderma cornu-damae]|uniref:Zinc finger domain-containing n=1 Tax=Trichoderma cornu-damae TaxID=654480 RepID=A0A9P8QNY7_9HYPO|nr:zinc finger domain-containing [Trichoderma cornu-damae]